jgi:hypothetical protein
MNNRKCVYESKAYEPGTELMQAGVLMRAGHDGRWHKSNESDSPETHAELFCRWEQYTYSEGAITCQEHERMRCHVDLQNGIGRWMDTTEKC